MPPWLSNAITPSPLEVVKFSAATNRYRYSDTVFPCCCQKARDVWGEKWQMPVRSGIQNSCWCSTLKQINCVRARQRSCKHHNRTKASSNLLVTGLEVVLPTPRCTFVPSVVPWEHISGLDGVDYMYTNRIMHALLFSSSAIITILGISSSMHRIANTIKKQRGCVATKTPQQNVAQSAGLEEDL